MEPSKTVESSKKSVLKYFLVTAAVIALDQASKLLVHYNMDPGPYGEIPVFGDWFKLYYLLNPGMAFGIQFSFSYGKLALTLFRLLATFVIAGFLFSQGRKGAAHPGFLFCVALILGGTAGNVIDSVFYGVFLEGNTIPGAPFAWFHGQVIDMLYFPLFDGFFPEWFPVWGGEYFLFFSPVFNIADSCIFIGIVSILLFQTRFFPPHKESETANHSTADPADRQHDGTAPENGLQEGGGEEEVPSSGEVGQPGETDGGLPKV